MFGTAQPIGPRKMLLLSPLNWHRQHKAAKTLARFIDQWTASVNR
jgi:hypothetical protein